MIPDIRIEEFTYELPEERIAKYPLERRDSSKLLIYKDGVCKEKVFREISEELPSNSIMVFNDTKVVPARLFFRRDTGAHIEIFCLKPIDPAEYATVFNTTEACTWRCVVGNVKRWKGDVLSFDCPDGSELQSVSLKAELIERQEETAFVRFTWKTGIPFSRVLEMCGQVPIPPYLNRETEAIDLERYQTLYARIRGSVAAPTAGLHFTDEVMGAIREKGIDIETVCLHVGAGTFLPVKSSRISGHTMHSEPFIVSKAFLKDVAGSHKKVIAVGTTSVRTLESLYYAGVSCIEKGEPCEVTQWCPYERDYQYTLEESFQAIINYLEKNNLDEISVSTRIIIVPGFRFRVVDMLVTNFHQPQSTLLLLISAFVDGDWNTIYKFALENNFRFLSYGDSSLLYRR